VKNPSSKEKRRAAFDLPCVALITNWREGRMDSDVPVAKIKVVRETSETRLPIKKT